MKILQDNNTPQNVIDHSLAVTDFALDLTEKLQKNGVKINKELVLASALLHDVERVKDNHVLEGAEYMVKLGCPEVAQVIKKHGLQFIYHNEFLPKTIEEKIIFYADKRIKHKKIVSLKERFDYIKTRYGFKNPKGLKLAQEIEKEFEIILKNDK